MDGNQVVAPENNWVRDMEKEWAATGYDDRFFDDDWDDVKPGPKPPAKEKFPFKNISDDDWKETVTWEDEEADGTISVAAFPSESYMLLFVPMRFELADRR